MNNQREIPLATTVSEKDISGREKLVNLTPRISSGGKYKFNLIGTPGLDLFLSLPTGPVLQTVLDKGRAFAVTPQRFYEIFTNGTYADLGAVNLSGQRVSMAGNGLQVVAVDGVEGYYYDTRTRSVSRITDAAFYAASTVTFQDQYLIFDRKGTGQFFITELASVAIDPFGLATAEGSPDNLVAVLSDHRELFLFGTTSIEVWFNSGAADFPFERNQGAFIEKGCAARYSIAKQDNTIFFIGSDLVVYRMDGYTPIRISSHAVEETLRNISLDDAFAYTYQKDGQLFYMLTIPANDITWAYNISTNTWDIRSSYLNSRYAGNNSIFFGTKTLIGDYRNGNIYVLDEKTHTENGAPLVREMILPTVNVGRQFISISSFELDMATGVGLVSGQGSSPLVEMRFSTDGGKNWSNWKQAIIGKKGNYLTRVKWPRLGRGRQFDFHVRISDPIPVDIGGAYVELKK